MVTFEQDGVVSVWVFLEKENPADAGKDVLKDFCGVEYYDLDAQEGIVVDDPLPLESLMRQLSYSESFIDEAMQAATRVGITKALGVLVQFDFAFDPTEIPGPIAKDPLFLGYFDWNK
jgi:hypothetical protein